ncbi:hypothetical protein QYE76_032187 [Lolium multiflorum]|uniref:Transposase (putative) gypsy type domain-containing protein n=1 Tax=Lolium multiflorum TaxID=4521 RepID=A0AAD8QUZ8_LOLMU|nr:hypothetical protein QYE76_032187 [Lolium multiflorum]
MAAEDLEWERSKISGQDMNLLKKMGFTKKENALRFPKEESYPSPPMEYRLHQLTPNSILHVSIFITLCECFLGVQPNWALWKRIFCLHRNGSHGVAYNIGGVVICVRFDVEYFDVQFPDSVQGWPYFLRIRVQPLQARKNPLWMYAGDEDVERLSKDLPVKDLEKLIRRISKLNKKDTIPSSCHVKPFCSTNPLPEGHPVLASLPPSEGGEVEERTVVTDDNQAASPKNKRKRDEIVDSGTSKAGAAHVGEAAPDAGKDTFNPYEAALPFMKELIRFGTQFVGYREYAAKLEGTLAESNKRADALAVKLEQSEKARKKAEADAAAVEDLRKRLHDTKTSLSENIAQQSAREEEIVTRLESQSRHFIRRTNQEYELENPEGDQLLDALSLLEIHGDEARDGLAEAKIGLSRLFPYFFKKKEEPATFVALAKCFTSQENLGLQLRQEGLKVGVEGTIALVADSQQVDWARVGNTEEMETKRWQSLIKAAKPNSKKILAYLGYNPTPAPSSSKPEVK